ncbi:MAG TPA: indole-3-glycerol phosphate synthase TrpC [Longimicrobiales bacterium]|nr:indole-3-glycerol phosphate synthase TrpC [Longimicrobiales bacterium]
MSGVLAEIVEAKRAEVEPLRRHAAGLRRRAESSRPAIDFDAALRSRASVGVIAEVKRKSPSAGEIRADAPAADIARAYAAAGAAAVSVLTDVRFFGGSLADLESAAADGLVPLLRKDFTVDPLQIYEARCAGAAAVLLIVRILDDAELGDFRALAEELGLAALVEAHDESEVERALEAGARIVGVNNRDLGTFTTDLSVTERLARYVPGDVVLVGESGIETGADVERLTAAGVDAVLVGETLMRADDPARLIEEFSAVSRQAR